MNTNVTVNALIGIRDNLNVLIDELSSGLTTTTIPAPDTAEPTVVPAAVQTEEDMESTVDETPKKSSKKTKASTSRKERESSETIPTPGNLTREQLDGLSYNNLKKLAKDMGVSATGARDELIEKIMSAESEEPAESEVVEKPDLKVVKSTPAPAAEDDDDDEDDEEEVDPIVAQVNEAVAEMSDEEIMDVLTEVGVRAKGKRQSLIAAVVRAVREGKLDLGEDEDEEDSDEEDDESESDEDEETEEAEEFDPNDPENPDMTKERRAAIKAHEKETRNDFKKGSLTRKEIVEWLNDFYGTKDSMKKKTDADLLDEYIRVSCLLINDDGEFPQEEGAYTVNGVPYCCGRPLQYNKDNNTYICESCGSEYEFEEE